MTETLKTNEVFKPLITRLTTEQRIKRATNGGFGQITAESYGVSGGPTVELRNYVTDDIEISPITNPVEDAYLAYMAVPSLGREGYALTWSLMPGLLEFYQRVGLTPNADELKKRLIQVTPVSME